MRLSSSEPPIAESLEAAEVVGSAGVVEIVGSAAGVVWIAESVVEVVGVVEPAVEVVGVAEIAGVAEASRPISFGVSF